MSASVENQGMSLADIAGLDVSDVEELRSSQIAAGLYTWEVTKGTMSSRMVKEDTELRYVAEIELKVIEADAVTEKGVTPEDMMGKTFTEKFFIDPAEAQKGVGFLKGFVTDIGADSKGAMGGLPEDEQDADYVPGFLDKLVTHRFKSKVVKKKGKDGEMYSRLQLLKKSAT